MKSRKATTVLLLAFSLTLVLVFIWGNSVLTGIESYNIMKSIFGEMTDEFRITVRKIVHVVEFFVLGVILLKVFRSRFFVLVAGLNIALIDEFLQTLSPGRYGSFKDVMIDFIGILLVVIFIQGGNDDGEVTRPDHR